MVITDYRVQSVLRTYIRQLQRSKLAGKAGRNAGGESSVEKISISDEGRRRHMMDRLTTQVFSRMYPKQDEKARTFGKESEAENGPVTEANQ
jgi:hypothetical protein